jgi:hypothetical protein
MGTNELILRLNQAGLETTRGTAVAATRKVYAQIEPTFEKPLAFFSDTSGTFAARRRQTYGRQRVSFSATDMATYEDLAWWMQMAIKGGVTGTGSASVGYTYAFTPSLATDDLKSMTLEFGEPGNPYEVDQVMVNSFTLRGDPDSDTEAAWMFEAEMMGRTLSTTTYTTSITDRTTEPIVARGTKLYVDTTAAGIGGTQVTGKLINWSITGNNAIHFKAFAEDESAMAANKVGRGERTYDGEMTVEFDDDTGNLSFATLRAGTPIYIRLEREGSTIATTYKKRLRVDAAAYISSISFGDREGNMTATIGFNCFYDSTLAADLKVEIINALSTLA